MARYMGAVSPIPKGFIIKYYFFEKFGHPNDGGGGLAHFNFLQKKTNSFLLWLPLYVKTHENKKIKMRGNT